MFWFREARPTVAFLAAGILIIAVGLIGAGITPRQQSPPQTKRIYEPTKARLERGRYDAQFVRRQF